MTHNCRFTPVVETMTNETTSLFRIETSPSKYLYCTENHPFYVSYGSNEKRVEGDEINKKDY